jgi:hypothetical protein
MTIRRWGVSPYQCQSTRRDGSRQGLPLILAHSRTVYPARKLVVVLGGLFLCHHFDARKQCPQIDVSNQQSACDSPTPEKRFAGSLQRYHH